MTSPPIINTKDQRQRSEGAKYRVRLLTVSTLVMAIISVSVIVTTLWTEYRTSFELQRGLLIDIAKSNARMIEAVARFDEKHTHMDRKIGALSNVVAQIGDAYSRLGGLGQTGEFALARLNGDMIEFLIGQRYTDKIVPPPVPMASKLAEPMRQALQGRAGTVVGLDYRGMEVLAAFEPIAGTDMGIVAKLDYDEIVAPHIRAGLIALAIGLLISITGIGFLYRYADPLVREINDTSERFRDFTDTASDWYWETDERFLATYISDRYLELLGLSRDQVIGQPLGMIMGIMTPDIDDDATGSGNASGDGDQDMSFWKILSTITDRVGNEHYMQVSGKAYFNDDGMLAGYRGTGADMTSRIKIENELKEFKTTLDRTLDCVFMFEPGTLKFTYANQGAIKQVGYSAEELMTMSAVDLKPEFNEEMFRTLLEPMIRGEKQTEKFETLHRSKTGTLIPVEIFLQYVKSTDEKPRFVAIVRDITDRQRANEERAAVEQALHDSQKMEALGHLSGGMAHEFNNMLVPMIGLTELTMDDMPEDSVERENMEIILDAAMRARGLIQQILAYARTEGRTHEAEDISDVIGQGIKLLRASLPTTVHLSHDLSAAKGAKVVCDPTEINQILLNLGKNAADAIGGTGGQLNIAMSIEDISKPRETHFIGVIPGQYVKIMFKDDGSGINEETQVKIFDPFFTTKEVGVGTGMGLSVVAGIIKNYGGAIQVTSAPGQGTTFEIVLPLHSLEAPPIVAHASLGDALHHQP